jgi:GntR family transcriptional regulator
MNNALERDSAVPLYAQLEEILTERIKSGEWSPDHRIPSENELNRIFGLSRMTVRGVLTKMVNDGLLLRVPGKGTFVTSAGKISAVSPAYRGVREQLEALGFETSTELVSSSVVTPSSEVQRQLGLTANDKVVEIVRLRSANGSPISIHRSYIPGDLAPRLDGADVIEEQLCKVLEARYGLRMKKVREHLEAVALNAQDAKYLGVRRGEPALLLEDIIFNDSERPFEYSRIVFRGDKLRLRFDYVL